MAWRKPNRSAAPRNAPDDGTDQGLLPDELLQVLRGLLTIPGVEGIGQPVTVLSPFDLPPDFLGFVERLRAGAVEEDKEMVLLTIPTSRGRSRGKHPVTNRLRRSFLLLCRHALQSGVPAVDVMALLDGAKRIVSAKKDSRGRRARKDAKPTTGTPEPPVQGG
jgi:hypothetical protein